VAARPQTRDDDARQGYPRRMNGRDLNELEQLLSQAKAVVAMEDIAAGETDPHVIGLRHDVDDNPGSLETAVRMAAWEQQRGYRPTTSPPPGPSHGGDEKRVRAAMDAMAGSGHEIGLHTNAIADALRYGGDPVEIIENVVDLLAEWGHPVHGVVAHGDRLCHE